MRCITIVYAVVLAVDLLVGTALIVWKCGYTDDDMECKLVTGGALGSLAVWLLLLLACPFCVIKVGLHEVWDKSLETLKCVVQKVRPEKGHQTYIQSEIYLPTTLSMRGPRDKVACDVNIMAAEAAAGEKAAHPLMHPRIEDVVPVPAIIYTFNEANREKSRSRSPTPCQDTEEA